MGYLMKKTSILFLLLSLCFVSCAGDDDDDGVSVGGGSGPCKGVTCSGHGTCYEIGDNLVSCNCEEGYVAEGIDCILDDGNGTDTGSDPCAGVTCSGHGNCYEKDGKPACNCEQGYNAQGTNCVEKGTSDPCAGKDCNDHGTCNASTGQCECEEGWKGDNCESFENGGPWKITVTGDINEEITFKYLSCSAIKDDSEPYKRAVGISIHTSKNASPPFIGGTIESILPKEASYLESINNELKNIKGTFNYSVNTSYNSTDNFEINITKYIDKESLEGHISFSSGKLESSSGQEVIITPNKFKFKCPCIFDGDYSDGGCGWPQ